MDSTCLNITGFIQPAYVVKLLSQDDFDGFNYRQLYVCPAERDVDYDELVPFDWRTTPELKRVYEIISHFYSRSVIYQLDEEAHELFKQYHDELYKGTQVKASEVSGRHLMPPVAPLPNSTNRYPTSAAESFLKCMKGLRFGEITTPKQQVAGKLRSKKEAPGRDDNWGEEQA